MRVSELHTFKNTLQGYGILFCYTGPLSQTILEEIGETLCHKMKMQATKTPVMHRVFSIFIEQVQNIINYSLEHDEVDDENVSTGIVIIGQNGERIYVLSGNHVRNERRATLATALENVRGLDKDALKALYKRKMQAPPEKGSKGAGLGFVDMARKASAPLEYAFDEVTNEISFFSLKVTV